MLNPMLNAIQVTDGECDLYNDLVVEAIQVVGIDFKYIQLIESEHNALNDAEIKKLARQFTIEGEVIEIQNFGGEADIFSNWGVIPSDTAVLRFAMSRFKEESKPFNISEPKEGDVLYDPVGNRLWEIRRVRTDDTYYVGAKRYSWIINCTIYQPKHEDAFDNQDYVFQGVLDDLAKGLPSQDESENFEDTAANAIEAVVKFDVDNPFGE
ncbi:neck protein [Acinetobacter phage SH-Ab 15599]|nr:neck protein [Acinetobacter phage SH-Ab 15599]